LQKIRQSMLLTSLIIVAVLLTSYLMISTDRLSHINRASVSMFTGVLVWVVFSVSGNNIHNTNLNHYVLKSVEVILFLLATNSIISIMNNNGVFDGDQISDEQIGKSIAFIKKRGYKNVATMITVWNYGGKFNQDQICELTEQINGKFKEAVPGLTIANYGFPVFNLNLLRWKAEQAGKAENYDEGGEGFAFSDSDDKNEGKEYRNDGVDVVDNQKGGYAIGYTKSGEWLEYTVEVLKDAEFGIEASASNGSSSFDFDVLADGKKLATLAGEKTADWDTYTMIESKSKVSLTKGKHVIKVLFNTDYTNLDYLEFTGEKVVTSVDDVTFDAKSVKVYPNPAHNEIMVSAPSPIRKIKMMTMSGVEVKESEDTTVDVSNLASGCYLVEVTTDEAVILKKVIVVR